MNKILIALAATAALISVVFAQVPGGLQVPQEAPRPGQVPTLGQGMRAGGGSASAAAYGDYVYVVTGNTLLQYYANGLRLVTRTTLPVVERQRGSEGGPDGAGGKGGRRNDPSAK